MVILTSETVRLTLWTGHSMLIKYNASFLVRLYEPHFLNK